MKIIVKIITAFVFSAILLLGCANGEVQEFSTAGESVGMEESNTYRQISQEEAMRIMESESGYIILDVRTHEEYYAGHIPGAICLPNEEITDTPPVELPDKAQQILVYCRSGRRSKEASEKLAAMGYSNILEFGGINTWTGEIVTEERQEPKPEDQNIRTGKLLIEVNGQTLVAVLADNSSAEALSELIADAPLTLELHDYSNFEKVGELPQSLPTNDEPLDTDYGDLILYQGNRFVIYYDKNSWTFTKLGHIEGVSKSDLKELLGEVNVTVTLSLSE